MNKASKGDGDDTPVAKSEPTEPSIAQLNALFNADTPPATDTRKIRIKYSRYNDEFECRGGSGGGGDGGGGGGGNGGDGSGGGGGGGGGGDTGGEGYYEEGR